MTRPWTADFDFYMAKFGDVRTSVFIDLRACEETPRASHPKLWIVRVVMLQPREDGLRSEEEAPALWDLENRLVAQLESQHDAWWVGRYIASRATKFLFYVPASAVPPKGLAAEYQPYSPEVDERDDPDWSFLREVAPDDYDRLMIDTRRQVRYREQQGDELSKPRPIDHYAFFDDQDAAERAAADLRGRGFTVRPPHHEDDGRVSLEFERIETLDGTSAEFFAAEAYRVTEAHGGDYDGWGGDVETA